MATTEVSRQRRREEFFRIPIEWSFLIEKIVGILVAGDMAVTNTTLIETNSRGFLAVELITLGFRADRGIVTIDKAITDRGAMNRAIISLTAIFRYPAARVRESVFETRFTPP
jgi:hypothetical protein